VRSRPPSSTSLFTSFQRPISVLVAMPPASAWTERRVAWAQDHLGDQHAAAGRHRLATLA
jgi:hypothetical protein